MNYKINAINILLNEDCILSRYYPLIPFIDNILNFSKINKITTKEDLLLCDLNLIFNNEQLTNLFKRFLVIYDNEDKLKLISKLDIDNDRILAYKDLFLLPGVKETRAELYYLCGYKNLSMIANSTLEEILNKMDKLINDNNLNFKLPLIKEIKTHIAVSKAFTM